jgi:hypothetical protein
MLAMQRVENGHDAIHFGIDWTEIALQVRARTIIVAIDADALAEGGTCAFLDMF